MPTDGKRRISRPHRVCRTAAPPGSPEDVRIRVDITRYLPAPRLPGVWSALSRETQFVRSKYRQLYELPVAEHSDGTRSFHDGWLYRCHGLNILFLRGDPVEMAFQHGRLLADEIPHGALHGSAKLIKNAVANSFGSGGRVQRWALEQAQEFLSRRIVTSTRRALARSAPDASTLFELVAIADASGTYAGQVVRALFNPEILLFLAGVGRSGFPLTVPVVPPTCCTSFAAWGGSTKGGDLLIGRNLDYPLNGFYDAFPTVVYSEPTTGLAHMSFTSSGAHNDGVTSYNEAGLFLASHVVPSSNGSLSGVPALVTADLATSNASSLSAAADLFRRLPSAAGWSYLAVDCQQREIGSLECSRRQFAMRPASGETHVQTNRFLVPQMHDCNLFLNASVDEDSDARAARVQQRLQAAQGTLDAAGALSILADQVDPHTDGVRGLGNTVALHTTLSSLVVDPARQRVLVSSGAAPSSHGDFVELPLAGTFDRRDFSSLVKHVHGPSRFRQSHPQLAEALQIFIRAKMAYEYHNDAERAYELLREVVQADDSNPAYFFQLGVFALKNERYAEAITAFGDTLQCQEPTKQLRRLAHYYRGRTHAHLSQPKPALADLKAVLDEPATDAKLRTAARRAAWRVKWFGRLQLRKRSLRIMMQQSDMLDY